MPTSYQYPLVILKTSKNTVLGAYQGLIILIKKEGSSKEIFLINAGLVKFRLICRELGHLISRALWGRYTGTLRDDRAASSGVFKQASSWLPPPPSWSQNIRMLSFWATCLFSAGSSLQAGESIGRQVLPQTASLGYVASDLQWHCWPHKHPAFQSPQRASTPASLW